MNSDRMQARRQERERLDAKELREGLTHADVARLNAMATEEMVEEQDWFDALDEQRLGGPSMTGMCGR
ncbi:MAG: hypothetical protein ACRDPE_23510 [Solirubrobacterales bacterium]